MEDEVTEAEAIPCPYCQCPHRGRTVLLGEDLLSPNTQQYMDTMLQLKGQKEEQSGYLHLNIHCHPEAGAEVVYCSKHGTLALFCNECGALQNCLLIAKGDNPWLQRIANYLSTPSTN